MNLVIALLVLGAIIFIHELGHFLVAKWNRVRVDEFAVGFGPKLWSTRHGETEYSVRLFVPLGGFNRIAGMDAQADDGDADAGRGEHSLADRDRLFNFKSIGQRSAIIAAGPAANFILAVALFFTVYGIVGIPRPVDDQPIIGGVLAGKPAAAAGLQAGDRVLSIDGQAIKTWMDMKKAIEKRLNQPTQILIERGGTQQTLTVTPAPHEQDPRVGMIGIDFRREVARLGPVEALTLSVKQTFGMIGLWFSSLFMIAQQHAPADVVGPVGIVNMISDASAVGLNSLLMLAGAISVTVGIINLLPLPALDGGRLVFLLVERLRGRPVDPARENLVHLVGFALLMLLGLLVTFKDIQRLLA